MISYNTIIDGTFSHTPSGDGKLITLPAVETILESLGLDHYSELDVDADTGEVTLFYNCLNKELNQQDIDKLINALNTLSNSKD